MINSGEIPVIVGNATASILKRRLSRELGVAPRYGQILELEHAAAAGVEA